MNGERRTVGQCNALPSAAEHRPKDDHNAPRGEEDEEAAAFHRSLVFSNQCSVISKAFQRRTQSLCYWLLDTDY